MTTLSLRGKDRSSSAVTRELAAGKRRRKVREALTGYLFVLPATLATLLFGLWPLWPVS